MNSGFKAQGGTYTNIPLGMKGTKIGPAAKNLDFAGYTEGDYLSSTLGGRKYLGIEFLSNSYSVKYIDLGYSTQKDPYWCFVHGKIRCVKD